MELMTILKYTITTYNVQILFVKYSIIIWEISIVFFIYTINGSTWQPILQILYKKPFIN